MAITPCSSFSDTSGIQKMSDNFDPRLFLGNFNRSPQAKPILGHFQGRRPLAEELEVVTIGAIRQCFGKKTLIDLIRRRAPLELPLPGGTAQVYLTWDSHHMPGPIDRKSMLEDKTARVWMLCPGCRRRVAKLFYTLWDASRGSRSELLCRTCNGLTYQSMNSGGTKWYRAVVRPLKRLLKQKAKLMAMAPRPQRTRELQAIDAELQRIRGVKGPGKKHRNPKHRSSSDRRPYRDVTLVEKYFC
jgi:hypothetical protein